MIEETTIVGSRRAGSGSFVLLDEGTEAELTICEGFEDEPVYDETMRFANGMRMDRAEADFIRANPRLMEEMRRKTAI